MRSKSLQVKSVFLEYFLSVYFVIENASEKYIRNGTYLRIKNVDDVDEGVYRCLSSNWFAENVNTEIEKGYNAILDQQLRVTSKLLFLFIYLIEFRRHD